MFAAVKTVVLSTASKASAKLHSLVTYVRLHGSAARAATTTRFTAVTATKQAHLVGVFARHVLKPLWTWTWAFAALDLAWNVVKSAMHHNLTYDLTTWFKLPLHKKVRSVLTFALAQVYNTVGVVFALVTAVLSGVVILVHGLVNLLVALPLRLLVIKLWDERRGNKVSDVVIFPTRQVNRLSLFLLRKAWVTFPTYVTSLQAFPQASCHWVTDDGEDAVVLQFTNDAVEEQSHARAQESIIIELDGEAASEDSYLYGQDLALNLERQQPGASRMLRSRVKKDIRKLGLTSQQAVSLFRGYDQVFSTV